MDSDSFYCLTHFRKHLYKKHKLQTILSHAIFSSKVNLFLRRRRTRRRSVYEKTNILFFPTFSPLPCFGIVISPGDFFRAVNDSPQSVTYVGEREILLGDLGKSRGGNISTLIFGVEVQSGHTSFCCVYVRKQKSSICSPPPPSDAFSFYTFLPLSVKKGARLSGNGF